MNMNNNNNLIDDCKKYVGLPPYDSWTNLNVLDPYYYKELCKKYGEDIIKKTLQEIRDEFGPC